MHRKILVTGANGFLGSNLVKNLKKDNIYIVKSTDLNGDVDIIGNLAEKSFVDSLDNFDVVVHCAGAQYHSRDLPKSLRKKYFVKNNVKTTVNLVEKFSNKGVHFIGIGSSMMYRNSKKINQPIDKNFSANGVYSDSKIKMFKEFQKFIGVKSFIIPSVIAGESRGGLFEAANKLLRKFNLLVIPQKEFMTSIIHVDDLVCLIKTIILQKDLSSGIFNASSVNNTSMREWIEEIAKQQGLSPYRLVIPNFIFSIISLISLRRILSKEQALLLNKNHVIDINTSLNLGWNPEKDLSDIISDVIKGIS